MSRRRPEDRDFGIDPRVPEEVFRGELEELGDRWKAVGTPERAAAGAVPGGASVGRRLVGLAFSGGGIRSATINLGITQALHRHGVFDHADYMSTVSGGGYLGSSISTLMRRDAEFPFRLDGPFDDHEKVPFRTESPYLTWVRNHSNYMTGRGFLDYMRIVAVLVRGILINFLTLLPWLLVLSLVVSTFYRPTLAAWAPEENLLNDALPLSELMLTVQTWLAAELGTELPYLLTPYAAGLVLAWFLLFPVFIRLFKVITQHKAAAGLNEGSVRLRDLYERSFGGFLLGLVAVVVIETFPRVLHWFHGLEASSLRDWGAAAACGSSVAAMASAGPVLAALGGGARKLARPLAMAAIALAGLLLPLAVVIYVTEFLVYGSSGFEVQDWMLAVLPAILAFGVVLAIGFSLVKVGFAKSRWLLGLLVILALAITAIY